MADDRKTQDRPVQRSYERHRLEEQLWSLAYQYVWPVIRKASKTNGHNAKRRCYENARASAQKARRA
jgi:hypothetical protein